MASCEVVHGDMLELLPEWSKDGFTCDVIVTDPPYHLSSIAKRFGKVDSAPAKHGRDGAAARLSKGFMGSETDSGDISFRPETWKACLDVLKPGGRAAVFGGTRTWWKTTAALNAAGFEIEDTLMWVYGQGLVLRRSRLKPGWEPILLARRPGPVADLNIDECRVDSRHFPPLPDGTRRDTRDGEASAEKRYDSLGGTDFAAKPGPRGGDPAGRWPGNLILDGSDDVAACFPDAPGQIARARTDKTPKGNKIYGAMTHGTVLPEPRLDSGSAARFFTECRFDGDEQRILYHGKAPSDERVFRCAICGEHAARKDRDAHRHGAEDFDHLLEHATVKPLSLMRHIVKLLCPPGGFVLDPFAGTFSTCIAAMECGRNAVGVERLKVHCDTGHERIKRSANETRNHN